MSRSAARRWLVLVARAGLVAHAVFLPISIAGMQIGLAVSVGALLLLRALGRKVWSRSALDLPTLVLCGAAVLSLGLGALAGSPPVGWHEATLWRSLLSPLVVLAVLALPTDGGDGPAPWQEVRRVALVTVTAWAAAALLPSAVAWAQHYTGFDPLHALGLRKEELRANAPDYPGHFAALGFFHWYQRLAHNLTPPVCLAGAIGLYGGLGRRVRFFLGFAVAAAAMAVVLTLSRSSWLGLAVGAGLLALFGGSRVARWALPLAVLVAGAVALLQPGIRDRFARAGSPEFLGDRELIWRTCSLVVEDYPLTGVGFGNLPQRSEPYWRKVAAWFPLHAWCHDSFLTALAEGGPILLAALVAWWALLARAFWSWRRGPEPIARAAAFGALAALSAMLVNALFHDILYSSETMYALGFALGLAAALARGAAPADAS